METLKILKKGDLTNLSNGRGINILYIFKSKVVSVVVVVTLQTVLTKVAISNKFGLTLKTGYHD